MAELSGILRGHFINYISESFPELSLWALKEKDDRWRRMRLSNVNYGSGADLPAVAAGQLMAVASMAAVSPPVLYDTLSYGCFRDWSHPSLEIGFLVSKHDQLLRHRDDLFYTLSCAAEFAACPGDGFVSVSDPPDLFGRVGNLAHSKFMNGVKFMEMVYSGSVGSTGLIAAHITVDLSALGSRWAETFKNSLQ